MIQMMQKTRALYELNEGNQITWNLLHRTNAYQSPVPFKIYDRVICSISSRLNFHDAKLYWFANHTAAIWCNVPCKSVSFSIVCLLLRPHWKFCRIWIKIFLGAQAHTHVFRSQALCKPFTMKIKAQLMHADRAYLVQSQKKYTAKKNEMRVTCM